MRKDFMNPFQNIIIHSIWRNFYMETWEKLLSKAMDYLDDVSLPLDREGKKPWSLGGGTVLMMEYQHRKSKDIDIFLSDPQLLGHFSPRLNLNIEADVADYNEQANYVKLIYDEGEIDFIVADKILDKPYKILNTLGKGIQCENPLEIIAKKVTHRHNNFAVRDFFDLATVSYHADKTSIDEMRNLLFPFMKPLRERLMKISSFDEIQVLPQGEFIQQKGKEILLNLLDAERGKAGKIVSQHIVRKRGTQRR
jgi:hypothetical protein